MQAIHADHIRDEDRLGSLAMSFRGTRDAAKRQAIAEEYKQAVARLIQGGHLDEMPPPEDQLPVDSMPPEFSQYWSCRLGTC
jgi:hypothetical protein